MFMEQGGIYAQVTLRGGGEYGEKCLLEAAKRRGYKIGVIDEPDYTAIVRPQTTWKAFLLQRSHQPKGIGFAAGGMDHFPLCALRHRTFLLPQSSVVLYHVLAILAISFQKNLSLFHLL